MSNYQFKTTNIRGKKYVEVNERIKYLRQEPNGFDLLPKQGAPCRCCCN